MQYSEKKYQELLKELFEKHPSVQNKGFKAGAYKPGLDGMKAFDERLAHPWKQYPSVLVAGTNGKGSVSCMLAAILSATGAKVGLYTSPHLVDFRERIKVGIDDHFDMIPKEYVFDFLTTHDFEGLSFFEITTGMALQYFKDEEVNIAIIEVGLGGRLDSTNIVTPIMSIITSIGLDHCALLGNTVEEIAKEKAGIIKNGVLNTIIGEYDERTAPIFNEAAKKADTRIILLGEREEFYYEDFDLRGPYQKTNIGTAVEAAYYLGIDIPKEAALQHAAKITGLRARWEIIQDSNPMIICDIGHNPAALKINFARLVEMNRPLFIVYGVMADKDYKSIRTIMPENAKYYGVAPSNERALALEKLSEIMDGLDYIAAGSVEEGVKLAIADASKIPDSIVYIGGSNFVVAEYLQSL